MKAFDAYLDRSARDSGFDMFASRALSREMELTLRNRFAERQKMGVACNYFALACPIMPVGLLGAFLMLEKLGAMQDREDVEKLLTHELSHRSDAAQELAALAAQQKAELEKRKNMLAVSRPVEATVKPVDKPKKRKDVSVEMEPPRSERVGGPNLLSKAHNDVSKVVKQKMALEEHLDRLNGANEYAMSSRVSAQIELLEKALKKMGA